MLIAQRETFGRSAFPDRCAVLLDLCPLRLARCWGMSNVDGERDGLIGDNHVVVFGL